MRTSIFRGFTALFLLTFWSLFTHAESVVLVTTYQQKPDFDYPWRKESIVKHSHMGTVVKVNDKKLILTAAFSLQYTKLIEAQKIYQQAKVELSIVFVDYEINLALLAPKDPRFLQDLDEVRLGDDVKLQSSVEIISAKDITRSQNYTGQVAAHDVMQATTSSYQHLFYLVKSSGKNLGWSEPVFFDDILVGMATGQSTEYVYVIPISVIRHFLEDTHTQNGYRGFPWLGLFTTPIKASNFRRILGNGDSTGGVRVVSVEPVSPFAGEVSKDWILLKVNDQAIDSLGMIVSTHLPYPSELAKSYGGDEVTCEFLNQGRTRVIKKAIPRYQSLQATVPYHIPGDERFLVYGGFVFQELSLPYLRAWGANWSATAPAELVSLYAFNNRYEPEPKRIIVLNRVLPDEYNRGYEDFANVVVPSVNGITITSLTELLSAFQSPEQRKNGRFIRIRLDGGGGDIILEEKGLKAANERIARNYGL